MIRVGLTLFSLKWEFYYRLQWEQSLTSYWVLWRSHPEFINKWKQKLGQRLLKGDTTHDKLIGTAKQAEGICLLSKHNHFPKMMSPCLKITWENNWQILICLLVLSQAPRVTLNKALTATSGKGVWHLSSESCRSSCEDVGLSGECSKDGHFNMGSRTTSVLSGKEILGS